MATITIHGNLAADPELRQTPDGKVVAHLRVLERTRRHQDEWIADPEPGHDVVVRGATGENLVESLREGDRVLVIGTTGSDTDDDTPGDDHANVVVTATAVGASLQHATVTTGPGKRDDEEENA